MECIIVVTNVIEVVVEHTHHFWTLEQQHWSLETIATLSDRLTDVIVARHAWGSVSASIHWNSEHEDFTVRVYYGLGMLISVDLHPHPALHLLKTNIRDIENYFRLNSKLIFIDAYMAARIVVETKDVSIWMNLTFLIGELQS